MYHEQIVSKLLLGFVERRISPQTILDCILAQIFEEKVPASTLTHATSNGIIEALSPASQLDGVSTAVLYVASHPDFPAFLSPKASVQGLLLLITHPSLQDPKYLEAVDGFCQACLNNIKCNALSTEQTLSLQEIMAKPIAKNLTLRSQWAARLCMEIFCSPQTYGNQTPEKVIVSIFQTPLEILMTLTPADFPHMGPPTWPMENMAVLLEKLHRSSWSEKEYHQGFLTQWFFHNSLEHVLDNSISLALFHTNIKHVLELAPRTWILKGLLKAWQSHTSSSKNQNTNPLYSNHIQSIISPFFWIISKGLEDDPQVWGPLWKPIVSWSLQLMVTPAASRIAERSTWQWVRILASKTWEDGMGAPAPWVIQQSENTLLTLCKIAPPQWLTSRLGPIIESLYNDYQKPSFALSKTQFDHLELVLRTLMNRVQSFSDSPEILMGLKMLGRLNASEESIISLFQTRVKIQIQGVLPQQRSLWGLLAQQPSGGFLGTTPLSRCLAMLMKQLEFQRA